MQNNQKGEMPFGLKFKLTFGIIVVAMITYITSGFFIFVLYPYISEVVAIHQTLYIILTLFLGVVWCGIFGYIGASYITKPITSLEKSVRQAATGDLSQYIDIPKAKDEISMLANSYNQMLENLKELISNIHTNGKATSQCVNDIEVLIDSSQKLTENMTENIEEISSGIEVTANSVAKCSESINNIRLLTTNINSESQNTKTKSERMMESLSNSSKSVSKLQEGLKNIETESNSTLTSVIRLEKFAEKINDIILMVGKVSDETNLLALNASIESARAGMHGKGFAIIAEHIRVLANQSTDAVKQVSEYIHNIQDEVLVVSSKMKGQVNIVKKENELGMDTDKHIKQMSLIVHEVNNGVEKVGAMIQDIHTNLNVTNEEINELAAMAEENASATQSIISNAIKLEEHNCGIVNKTNELKVDSEKLNNAIALFK